MKSYRSVESSPRTHYSKSDGNPVQDPYPGFLNLDYIQNGHSRGKVREFKSVRENRKSQGKCVHACTKFGQLVLRKIIEIVATRCQILRLKCTK